jgi:hypothetical protein
MTWEGEDLSVDTTSATAMPDGAVTTTIAFGQLDADNAPELSEEEIERTIREIRSAIEKTSSR